MYKDLVTIAGFLTSTEAELIRQVLQDEGIDAYLAGDKLIGGFDLCNTVGGVKVQVAAEDEERSLAVLAEVESGGRHQPSPSVANCPRCKVRTEVGFAVCWSCGCELETDSGESSRQGIAKSDSMVPPPSAIKVEPASVREDDSEERLAATAEGDAMAARAWRAAILGLVLCPPVLHIYSAWTLLKLGARDLPLSERGSRRFYGAAVVDIVAGATLGYFMVKALMR